MRKLIYLAGPFSKDPIHSTTRAIKVADQLIELGYVVIIPHLSMFHQLMSPKRTGFFWYWYDLELLHRCDMVYRMKGKSFGADLEVKKAGEWGLPVVFEGEPNDPIIEGDWI